MAELHVQRKPSGTLWVWLLLILLVLAAGAYFYVHYYQKNPMENTEKPRSSLQAPPAGSLRA